MVSPDADTSAVALPPAAGTRNRPCPLTANTISPFLLQVPPRPAPASQRVNAGPPARSIFFSLPSAKNAMERLSGDQKGSTAPSVPVSARAESESRSRTQSWSLPSSVATKARRRPSGEIAGRLVDLNVALSGGSTDILSTRGGASRKWMKETATATERQ